MKRYILKNTPDVTEAVFETVGSWPWKGYECEYLTRFRAVHTDNGLAVSIRCYEKEPYAGVTKTNGYVCNDSCLEFFFSPSADSSAGYFNFEVNSNPTYLFGYNPVGGKEEYVQWDESEYALTSTKASDEAGDYWQVDFKMPYAMIKKYVPEFDISSGAVWRGNVYKCGKHNQHEHYGSWSPVGTDGPNFHRPEFFGEFVFE